MIELTRLNGNPLYVNSDLIKWAEAAPDTLLTLINGEKVVVRESCLELVERVHQDRLSLLNSLLQLMPHPGDFLRAVTAVNLPSPSSRISPEATRERQPGYRSGNDDEAAESG